MSVTFFRLDRERIERALRLYVQALAGDPKILANDPLNEGRRWLEQVREDLR